MTASKSSECRRCGDPIVWAVTEKQRTMPVDPHPHPEGTVRLREHAGSFFAKVLRGDALFANQGPLHRRHSTTCAVDRAKAVSR